MHRQIRIVAALLVLGVGWVQPARSEDSGRRLDNLAWTRSAAGSRAQALGGAVTARANDGTAPFWNPAFIESFGPYDVELTAMALPLTLERRAAFASYIQTLGEGRGSLGFSWQHLRIGGIEERAADGALLGRLEDLQNAFRLSYGLGLGPDWKVGGSLAYFHHALAGETGQGIGGDIAAAFNPKREWLRWEFGLMIRDLSPGLTWSTGRHEAVYPAVRAGAAYHIIYDELIASVDLDWVYQQKASPHGGVEWWPWPSVAVRVGLDNRGIHTGAGFRYDALEIDYSFSAWIEGLSDEHRVTLMYKL